MTTNKIKINKWKLRDLILEGITSEKLNSNYDYSEVTDMSWLFNGCSDLETIPHIDTSKVEDMSWLFYSCFNLELIPELDTSSVKVMRCMFDMCNKLRDFDPYNFPGYDFSRLPENKYLRENYPEFFI